MMAITIGSTRVAIGDGVVALTTGGQLVSKFGKGFFDNREAGGDRRRFGLDRDALADGALDRFRDAVFKLVEPWALRVVVRQRQRDKRVPKCRVERADDDGKHCRLVRE